MLTIAVVSQKGGAGKSTLTVHLAVAAMLAGSKVAILDTDPQGSVAAWGEARVADNPPVIAVAAGDLAGALAEARAEGYDVIFIDTQPRASASVANVIGASSWALIPVRPSAFDITTADQTQRLAVAAGTPFAFVLNACPARAREVAEGREVLAALGPVLDATFGERRAYGRALQTGLSVQEFDANSEAAREVASAWSEIQWRSNGTQVAQGARGGAAPGTDAAGGAGPAESYLPGFAPAVASA